MKYSHLVRVIGTVRDVQRFNTLSDFLDSEPSDGQVASLSDGRFAIATEYYDEFILLNPATSTIGNIRVASCLECGELSPVNAQMVCKECWPNVQEDYL